MHSLRNKYERFRRKKILNLLQNADPEKLTRSGLKKLPAVVSRAAASSPAYRSLLEKHKVQISAINNQDSFHKLIPVTNKENFFSPYSYTQLTGRKLEKVKLAMTSSGYSGTFAYGFISKDSLKVSRSGVDLTLDYWFDISHRSSFLINVAPMGVHVETSLPLAEVSVRSDMAIALLKKVSPAYEQTIIAGDPYFLKKIIEEGTAAGIPWKKLAVSLITAQDWLPESLRTYMARHLEIEPGITPGRGIFATMGMTELGLNVFHESPASVLLRRKILSDRELCSRFFDDDIMAPPYFFHYYPFRTYIESVVNQESGPELIFTVLDPESILPVIRYATGDQGILYSYKEVEKKLQNGYEHLTPDLRLPMAMMAGRKQNQIHFKNNVYTLEAVKEGLFSDHQVASEISGLVGLEAGKSRPVIKVHLKKGVTKNRQIKTRVAEASHQYLHDGAEIQLFSYDEPGSAVDLNYEKKLIFR